MSSPNFGDFLVAGAGGAALGFLDNQQKVNDDAKVKLEQERQVKLLMLKEEMASRREMDKQKDQQAFEMLKLGKDQEFKAGESSKDRAAKLIEAGDKAEFERWKTEQDNASRLSVANINAEARKESASARGGSGDERAIRSTQARLRRDYKRDVRDWEINNQGEAAPDFDTWADENYPEDYDFAFPGGSSGESRGPSGGAPAKGENKLDSIFNEYGASRTKKGPNDGKQPMPAATGAPGDVVEPQPISVGAGDKVTSAAPVSGRGYAQAASGPPPVDELPMRQEAPSRAAELKAQAEAQRSGGLVSTVGAGDVFSAASEIAKGFVAGTKKGATILADLYMAFVGEPFESVVKWGLESQNQQAAIFLLEQRLKNGVLSEKEYNTAVAQLRS